MWQRNRKYWKICQLRKPDHGTEVRRRRWCLLATNSVLCSSNAIKYINSIYFSYKHLQWLHIRLSNDIIVLILLGKGLLSCRYQHLIASYLAQGCWIFFHHVPFWQFAKHLRKRKTQKRIFFFFINIQACNILKGLFFCQLCLQMSFLLSLANNIKFQGRVQHTTYLCLHQHR